MKKNHKLQSSLKISNKSLVYTLALFILMAVCQKSVIASSITNGSTNYDHLPPDVWESLEKQAAAMSKISLTYSEIESRITSANSLSLPTTNYLYIDENRIYLRTVYSYLKDENFGRPILEEYAFDGTYFYSGNQNWAERGSTNLVLVKYLPSDGSDPDISVPVYLGYLKFANFYAPSKIADFAGFGAVESRVLHALQESDSTEVSQEGEMLQVTVHVPDPLILRARATNLQEYKTQMEHSHLPPDLILKRINVLQRMANMDKWHRVTFWLDPKFGYSVVKSEEFAPTGEKSVSINSDQWQYFESPKVWLPRRSAVSLYADRYYYNNFSNSPSLLITDTLNAVSVNLPSNAAFTLAYTYNVPGAHFVDRTTPQARTNVGHQVDYTIAANGNVLHGTLSDISENMNRHQSILWDFIFSILAIPPLIILIISLKKRFANSDEK